MTGKRATVELTGKQRMAVEALARGASIKAAATAAGVHDRTIYKWRQKPEFIAALRAVDAENLKELARQLTAASLDAIGVLASVMNNKATDPSTRVRAASEILRHRAAFYELANLTERVDALERGAVNA